ncbi:MAG: UDP-N-acetylmuramoyl-tripeptide--D-alanyl-D-alanine ligase [Lachnospiraceae bacterium]|nr:UDP-N-acetylmuramoyl-tripeptide--D-alanyl-D-alanine ligase [Lachnospiraceae bacterium]
MNHITIDDICKAVDGSLLIGDGSAEVHTLAIDSREVTAGSFFIPVIGEKVDAHRFLPEVLRVPGVVGAFTSRHHSIKDLGDLMASWEGADPKTLPALISVDDTVAALTALGHLCRSRVSVPAVGVTGSVGKTSTREMIATALSAEKKVYRTKKNHNSLIGVPLTMAELTDEDDIAVLELGMNVPGELGGISEMARLSAAVITNIGVAHMEFYESQEGIAREKFTITRGLFPGAPLFLNGEDPYLRALAGEYDHPVTWFGFDEGSDVYADEIVTTQNGSRFVCHMKGKSIPVELTVPGRHHVLNALAALAVSDFFGVDPVKAAEALKSFSGFQNRLQIEQVGDYKIIDDSYNASPASMRAGLDVLCDQGDEHFSGKRIAFLGDMLELGKETERFHMEVGSYAADQEKLDAIIGVGKLGQKICEGAAKKLGPSGGKLVAGCNDLDQAFTAFQMIAKPGDILYFKASNGMHFKELIAKIKNEIQDKA